eukprot:GILJ01005133.1.p1 GENE.GILJ01005133.1~~GILJ01005133.1.p1  ORF type:complete len:1085 (+),score=158.91 GILJ01005133.1:437-3256(+)
MCEMVSTSFQQPTLDHNYARHSCLDDSHTWVAQMHRLLWLSLSVLFQPNPPAEPFLTNIISSVELITDPSRWGVSQIAGTPLVIASCRLLFSGLIDKRLFRLLGMSLARLPLYQRDPSTSATELITNAVLLLSNRSLSLLESTPRASPAISSFVADVLSVPSLTDRLPPSTLEIYKDSTPLLWRLFSCLDVSSVNSKQLQIDAIGLDGVKSVAAGWLLGNLIDFYVLTSSRISGASVVPASALVFLQLLRSLLDAMPSISSTSNPTAADLSEAAQAEEDIDEDDLMEEGVTEEGIVTSKKEFMLPTTLARQIKNAFKSVFVRSLFAAASSADGVGVEEFCSLYCTLFCCQSSKFTPLPPMMTDVLTVLAFSTSAVDLLWRYIQSRTGLDVARFLSMAAAPSYTAGVASVLCIFCLCYQLLLAVQDDNEFHSGRTFNKTTLISMAEFLNQLSYRMFWFDSAIPRRTAVESGLVFRSQRSADTNTPDPSNPGAFLRKAAVTLVKELHARDSRRPFCPSEFWLIADIRSEAFFKDAEVTGSRSNQLLHNIPHVLSFQSRVQIFQTWLATNKDTYGERRVHGLSGYRVQIRRNHLVEDGFNALNQLGSHLRSLIQVSFVSAEGVDELGIDGGGLFKEFIVQLTRTAFGPEYGLFKETSEHTLYPNPASYLIPDHLKMFEFLGRMVGKALYEGILLEARFARVFLNRLLGKLNTLDDLPSLDPDMYRNLVFLKNYEGDLRDLALNFVVLDETFGVTKEYELIPGGRNIEVTRENRLRYVHSMAHYRMNTQIRTQCDAFLRGLRDLIPLNWLKMFTPDEIQLLLAGFSSSFDVEDLKRNCTFGSGYHETDAPIQMLWEVLESFDDKQRADFLMFTTSCSRAPLLGFKDLYPRFCVLRVNIRDDSERLPTSSTCVNTLKLPTYSSAAVMREKLLYAISSGAGFEMS